MGTYDLLMLAILVGLTLYGYFKGMAWQVAYVASFVASYFLATRFADQMAPRITGLTGIGPPANKFVAMAAIYAVASFGIWMLFRMVSKMIDRVKMEGFDHQMGAFLGFGRGVLWCVAVTFVTLTIAPIPVAWKQQVVQSRSGFYIATLIDKTESVFPPEVHQVVGPYLERLGNELGGGGQQPGALQPSSPGGWPTGGGAPNPAPANPAWGQTAPAAQPAAPAWPGSAQQTPAWPQSSNQASAQPAASDFGWPEERGGQPATPASSVSWPPEWE